MGFLAASTGVGAFDTGFALPVPNGGAGLVPGDEIVAFVEADLGTSPAIAGFTHVATLFGYPAFQELDWYTKTYAGETADYAVTYGASSHPCGIAAAYRGVSFPGTGIAERLDFNPTPLNQSGAFTADLGVGAVPLTDITVMYVAVNWPIAAASADNAITPVGIVDNLGKNFRARVDNLTVGPPVQNLAAMALFDEYVASSPGEPAFNFDITWEAGVTFRGGPGAVQVMQMVGGGAAATPGVGVGVSAPMIL